MNTLNEAPRRSQLKEQTDNLDRLIERIAKSQSELETKLSSILMPEAPRAIRPGAEEVSCHLVPAANDLRVISNQLEAILYFNESVLSRIEA